MSKKAGEKETDEEKQKAEAEAAAQKTKEEAAASAAKEEEGSNDEGKTKKPEKTFSKAELDAAAKKAVDDAKKKWDDEKDLTEIERLKKENQELAASMRMRDAKEEVVAALTQAGSKSPAMAFEAIKATLKFDDSGKLVNSKDLIDSLKTSYPEQFGTEKPAEGIDAGKGQKAPGEKLTKEKLAAMTTTEINNLDWAEVSAVMAEK